MSRRALAWSIALFAPLAFSACGSSVPTHNGYRSARARPWVKPKIIELDETFEGEVDDSISYPKRRRARWYALDLPRYGELDVTLRIAGLGLVERASPIDVAFEVLDESYRVLTRADAEEDDAGDEEKSRTLYELDAGRYLIHVYAQERLDSADFTLQVAFRSEEREYESNFPALVLYPPRLPAVPPVDDAPAEPVVVKKRCKNCKRRKPKPTRVVVRARISGISTSTKGTRIKIDRGSGDGIAVGWRGQVITKSGAAIPGGRFTVGKVSPSESYASVRATSDAVNSAKYVRMSPPD